MALPRMRPAFVVEAECDFDELMKVLRAGLDERQAEIDGHFTRKNGVLSVVGEHRRFWSPVLDLTITGAVPSKEDASGRSHAPVEILGVFAPRPEIWTGLVFSIGSLTILSFISTFFALAQYLSGFTPWVLWVPFGCVLTIVAIYGSALVGQGLAGDNMYRLRAFVDTCVQTAVANTPPKRALPADASAQL